MSAAATSHSRKRSSPSTPAHGDQPHQHAYVQPHVDERDTLHSAKRVRLAVHSLRPSGAHATTQAPPSLLTSASSLSASDSSTRSSESNSDADSSSDSDASSSSESHGGSPTPARRPALRARLQAFLPALAAANQGLAAVESNGFEIAAAEKPRDGNEEEEEGGVESSGERYIEMNLGLGVLEQQRAEGSDDNMDEDDGRDEPGGGEPSVMDALMGRKTQRHPKPAILEVG